MAITSTILSRSVRAARPVAGALPRLQNRSLSALAPIYTAVSTSTGSRAKGASSTQEGNISLQMGMPKEMGGSAKVGPEMPANPEQLFGMAYGTCFLSALAATHGILSPKLKPLPKTTSVTAKVSLGKKEGLEGFSLGVELEVAEEPLKEVGLDDAGIKKLLVEAHKLCPYSRATSGNIETEIRLAA